MEKTDSGGIPQLFANGHTQSTSDNDRLIAELYRQIGQLKVELDWLQKNSTAALAQKRQHVKQESGSPSVSRQCELLGLPRASYYYQPAAEESPENQLYMRLIDEQYIKTPCYGVPRMTDWLCDKGYAVNRKRIARLMRKMDLVAIYPKPRLSKHGRPSKKYAYLLKDSIGLVQAECLTTFSLSVSGGPSSYEHVYLHSYDSVHAAWCGLNNYFNFYNEERLHTSLNTRTPYEVYFH